MKRKQKIRTDVPTLWLDEGTNILRIIWPDGLIDFLGCISGKWHPSFMKAEIVREYSYYCGPLFVSKENEL